MSRIVATALALLCSWLCCWSYSYAQSLPVLKLSNAAERHIPEGFVEYFREPGAALTLQDALEQAFARVGDRDPNFGFTTDTLWLRVRIEQDAAAGRTWLLRSRIRFMRPAEIFVLRADQAPELVLQSDVDQVFADRTFPSRHLVAPIRLEPKEQVQVIIRFRAGGAAVFPFEFVTTTAFEREEETSVLIVALAIAILVTLMLVNLALFIARRDLSYFWFVAQEAVTALYLVHLEGFGFQYLWPNLPAWNAVASPILGALALVATVMFGAQFLRVKTVWPMVHRGLMGCVAAALVLLVISPFVESRITNQLGLLDMGIGTALLFCAALRAALQRHLAAYFFVASWVLRAAGHYAFVASMFGAALAPQNALASLMTGVVAQAFVLSLGFAALVKRLNDEHIISQKELIDSLQARLEESRERTALESAKTVAEQRYRDSVSRLATTSHDMKQPIHALQLLANRLQAGTVNNALVGDIRRSLAFLQSLVTQTLDVATPTATKELVIEQPAPERIAAGFLIEQALHDFRDIAGDKGIDLRAHDSSLIVTAQVFALRRVLNNFISNAVAHTRRGGVLVAARRRNGSVVFQVFDTGPGISDERMATLKDPFVKGEGSVGSGLGLTIVDELCRQQGWYWRVRSVVNQGSMFEVEITSA